MKKTTLTLEDCKTMMDRNGGWLYLSGTQITALPDNLTVGGSLDLRGTQITALPDNLTVGGSLYLSGTQISYAARQKVKHLRNGDVVLGRYIYCDNILTHITTAKKVGKYTVYKGKFPGRNVVSDGVNYAHCDKFRDGIADLAFKTAADRGADQYKGMSLEYDVLPGQISMEDVMEMEEI